jgi:uncharacterized protein (TIGR02757 family)
LSFLLQGLCYGRVEQIKVSYMDLLKRLEKVGLKKSGAGIYSFVQQGDFDKLKPALKTWRHRLNKPNDLLATMKVLKNKIYSEHKSIKDSFLSFDHKENETFEQACFEFCKLFEAPKRKSARWTGTGASWFAPSPENGGTSKRLMMWLRWMIREDSVDLGLWKRISPSIHASPSKLLIPVDTHIFKFAQKWGLIDHKSPSWKSVLQITAALRKVDPQDPVKFDFSICHEGKMLARSL